MEEVDIGTFSPRSILLGSKNDDDAAKLNLLEMLEKKLEKYFFKCDLCMCKKN